MHRSRYPSKTHKESVRLFPASWQSWTCRSACHSNALLYPPSDISRNLEGIKQDINNYCKTESCIRENILHKYGYEMVVMHQLDESAVPNVKQRVLVFFVKSCRDL